MFRSEDSMIARSVGGFIVAAAVVAAVIVPLAAQRGGGGPEGAQELENIVTKERG
jgi:hypothetical protein